MRCLHFVKAFRSLDCRAVVRPQLGVRNPLLVPRQVLRTETLDLSHLDMRALVLKMQEHQKAREELMAVLKMYPDSNDARFQLGELDSMERRYNDAEAD